MLDELLRAIASADRERVSRLIESHPGLARSAIRAAATRASAGEYYLDSIEHDIYAGDTPLHIAAAAYDVNVAKALVARGANASARNRLGAEPLHYAAAGQPGSSRWNPTTQANVVEYLISVGADPNTRNKNGVGPLHVAVRTRCSGAVRALLASGADPNLANRNGSTPLSLATRTTGRGGSGTLAAKQEQATILHLLEQSAARRMRSCALILAVG